ncbi:hypothetical protein FHX52_1053 [Humibacillus xanthopallidus]|uniref:Uncharacterized protein n=1 Tax=Humibacillus xanthopallidus TaxID=412689 RepID=A0A543PV35_9MICO|nr:hypothetical protein [Humibacillus xanthopallidus]TQN47934.1 hypothetical protein FHX52_1053 [Humibacillus xanthopallidus]
MRRPSTSIASTSRSVVPSQHPDAPRFDPHEHGWTGEDGGLGHASDPDSLVAAAHRYAAGAAHLAGRHVLATDAARTYRRRVLGLTARDVVLARHAQ